MIKKRTLLRETFVRMAGRAGLFEILVCSENFPLPVSAVHPILEIDWSGWTVLINSRILLTGVF